VKPELARVLKCSRRPLQHADLPALVANPLSLHGLESQDGRAHRGFLAREIRTRCPEADTSSAKRLPGGGQPVTPGKTRQRLAHTSKEK